MISFKGRRPEATAETAFDKIFSIRRNDRFSFRQNGKVGFIVPLRHGKSPFFRRHGKARKPRNGLMIIEFGSDGDGLPFQAACRWSIEAVTTASSEPVP